MESVRVGANAHNGRLASTALAAGAHAGTRARAVRTWRVHTDEHKSVTCGVSESRRECAQWTSDPITMLIVSPECIVLVIAIARGVISYPGFLAFCLAFWI